MFGGKKIKELEAEIARLQALIAEQNRSIEASQKLVSSTEERVQSVTDRVNELERQKIYLEQDNQRLHKRVVELTSSDARATAASDALRSVLVKFSDDICERIVKAVTVATLESSRRQIERIFDYCKSVLPAFDNDMQLKWSERLKTAHAEAMERERLRQEQALIKERMREEIRAERERQKELERLAQEEEKIRLELERILLKKETAASALQIEELKQQLLQAQERSERAKSQAELTRAGHVYVISNVGSFGEGIYKVGMTRRLEPYDRVHELGDASVPFPFDVHMMISCDDAPKLESDLHRLMHGSRVNKVNLRKEYFRVDLEMIHKFVEENHGKVEYHAEPQAIEFHETKLIEERGFEADYDPNQESDEDLEQTA
ncbi:MAG TPA: GIY-YIG nuclease family protein [Oligoflexus sp.]|uniref:GIY-YIG nuclease family protein n=1 Tax=Oligoflexus sp. TaxID=1971216 RepID=UPI002D8057AE|nr:GIY-YIG nuclease family protein [Oligoflexus sp.]HET9236153.1 GIY-YIG nuclease family protein [Oligoflexus sp.]